MWDTPPLPPLFSVDCKLAAHFWSSLPRMASSGLAQHWFRGRGFWVTLSKSNVFLWTFLWNYSESQLFLPLIVEPSQAVKCNLFIYADTGLVSQHVDIIETEKQLNQDFERICDWFVNNKQSIHIGDGKTKSILFATKFKNKRS